jgi:hypothetical protein
VIRIRSTASPAGSVALPTSPGSCFASIGQLTGVFVAGPTTSTNGLVSADLAGEIQHVLGEVLEPAAAAVGLEVSYPHLGPISRVGPIIAAAMRALAEAGDGQWPLPKHVEPYWKSYVSTAFRDDVAISPEQLTAWFSATVGQKMPRMS